MSENIQKEFLTSVEKLLEQEKAAWDYKDPSGYFVPAEQWVESQWKNQIFPFLNGHEISYESCLDLGCGRGRYINKLLEISTKIVGLDINANNVDYAKNRFSQFENVSISLGDGVSLTGVNDESISFVFSYDTLVFVDLMIIYLYLFEIHRVLIPGGYAFIHHSNNHDGYCKKFTENVRWRAFMSSKIFSHLAYQCKLEVVDQRVIALGDVNDLDCFSLLRKL